jgi:hypothetical protein
MLVRPWVKGIMVKETSHVLFAIALAAAPTSACAMTAPTAHPSPCQVVDGAKLPTASGGADEVCRALERALAARPSAPRFTVRVRVEPRSVLTADVTLADGRTLPELHMAEMDRPITKDTLDRFGQAIVDHASGSVR